MPADRIARGRGADDRRHRTCGWHAYPGLGGFNLHEGPRAAFRSGADGPGRTAALFDDTDGLPVMLEIRDAGGAVLQRLTVEAPEAPPRDFVGERLRAEDLDGDGNLDLRVFAWAGATGNSGDFAWRWDAPSERYVEVPGFANLSQVRVVPQTHCLTSHARGGAAGMIAVDSLWCWRGSVLENTRVVEHDVDANGNVIRITGELRDGQLVETDRLTIEPAKETRTAE